MGKIKLKQLILWGMLFLCLGCQSGENETAQKETTQKETIRLTPVSIQLQWVTQAQFAGYYVALEKGWYEQEGLDVTIYPGGPDIAVVDLVAGGARDFGTTLLADLVVSIQKGKAAVSIAQIQQNNGVRLLAKTASNIKTIQDLADKKVGVWLGGWEVQFNALLAQEQIDPKSVMVVSQGFSMRPFIDGRIDVASAMIYNEYEMVLAAGISPNELKVIDYADYNLDFPGDVFITSQTMIDRNPLLCKKMVQASLRGWQYAMENIDEAVKIILKYDTSGVAMYDHQKKMMTQISKLIKGSGDTKLGMTDSQTFSRMINLLVKYKMLSSPLTENDVYTLRFVDQIIE